MSELSPYAAADLPWLQESQQWLEHCLSNDKLPHAILLVGAQGMGKRAFANHIAQQLLVQRVAESSRVQASAQWAAGSHPDYHAVHVAEGKKDIAIDQIRELIGDLHLTAFYGGYRIALIAPAERMSISATNSLLKCLEEPPKDTVLILLAEHLSELKPTIRSRCQIININRPSSEIALDWLRSHRQDIDDVGDDAALKVALKYHHGAPISALQALQSDEVGVDSWWQELQAVIGQQKTALAVAAELARTDNIKEWFNWCQQITQDALLVASQNPHRVAYQVALPTLQGFMKSVPLNRAFDYAGYLQQLSRMADTTVNKQMLLEAALIPWALALRVEAKNRFSIS